MTLKCHRARWMVPAGWLVLLGMGIPLHGRVFTLRPGNAASLENPESIGAKRIYGGRFLINGCPAEMEILAGSMTVSDTVRLLKEGLPPDALEQRASGNTVVGKIKGDAGEKRFLITAFDRSRSCLVFVLHGNASAFSREHSRAAWPSSLPILDPLQRPQLVVEHLEDDFLFASVLIPQTGAQSALETCQEQLRGAGWSAEPLTQTDGTASMKSVFALFSKKGKTCWLEAAPGAERNQVMVTLLCKKS